MLLHFEMNVDKYLLDNDMDSDNEVLYNFTYATSQLLRDDDVAPWRLPQEKHPIIFSSSYRYFLKP